MTPVRKLAKAVPPAAELHFQVVVVSRAVLTQTQAHPLLLLETVLVL